MSKQELIMRDDHSGLWKRIFTFKVLMRTLETILMVVKLTDLICDFFGK